MTTEPGWPTVNLGDYIRQTNERRGDQSLPSYSVTKHYGFVSSYFKKDVHSADLSKYKVVNPGEFAYATIHLDEGSIGIASERCVISPMYTTFAINSNMIDPNFLLLYLKSEGALLQYSHLGTGSVERRKNINFSSFSRVQIPLPPLDEQRRIAGILDRASEVFHQTTRQSSSIELAFSTLTQLATTRSDTKKVTAGEIFLGFRNGVSPSKSGTASAQVLTLSAVTGANFEPKHKKPAAFSATPGPEKRVSSADLLICRGNGNLNLVGRGVRPRKDLPDLVFPDTVIAGQINTDLINPNVLEVIWNLPEVRDDLKAIARSTSGIYKINQQTLSSIPVPLPSPEAQIQLSNAFEKLQQLKGTLVKKTTLLQEFQSTLRTRAFRGEL